MAASGAGTSQLAISLVGGPIAYSDVAPGAYTICVVPFPADVQGAQALSYIQTHGLTLPAFCQPELVTPAPATQSVSVPVTIPANAGSGSAG
jgi:hypothetical protein